MRIETESILKPHWRALQVVLIVILTIAVYSNTLHGQFVFDDANLGAFSQKNLRDILLYGGARRVADVTFLLNYRLHGLQVTGYHLFNLAIHLSASLVLYFVINSLISALRVSASLREGSVDDTNYLERYVPLTTALLFAVHPIQTQAVTYIIQRYTCLATLCYLLSILFYLRGRLAYERSGVSGYPMFLGGISVVAGVLAVGSKQIAYTLPLMLAFIELYFFRGRLINRKVCSVVGALFLLFAGLWLYGRPEFAWQDVLDSLNKASSEDVRMARTTYFLTQVRVVATYLRLLCLPLGQNLLYDFPLVTSLFSWPVIASFVLHCTLLSTSLVLYKRSKENILSIHWVRGASQRLVSFGIIWFYSTMMIESSIFPIRDVMFEHRIYLPSVGFLLAISSAVISAAGSRSLGAKVCCGGIAAVCLVFGGMTVVRNQVWASRLTLWQDTVKKSPNKALALANLGGEYAQRKLPDKAIPLFVKALELGGDFPAFLLGEAFQEMNMYESRFTTGKEFIRPVGEQGSGVLDDTDKSKYESVICNTVALAYEYLGETENALKYFRKSLERNPEYELAWYNLGLLADRMGDKSLATTAQGRLQALNPVLADALAAAKNQSKD